MSDMHASVHARAGDVVSANSSNGVHWLQVGQSLVVFPPTVRSDAYAFLNDLIDAANRLSADIMQAAP